jgi:hypothetical protein
MLVEFLSMVKPSLNHAIDGIGLLVALHVNVKFLRPSFTVSSLGLILKTGGPAKK